MKQLIEVWYGLKALKEEKFCLLQDRENLKKLDGPTVRQKKIKGWGAQNS